MGKEHHKVVAHNFRVRLEGSVEFSFELQLHHRDFGRFVTCSRSEVHEVNLQVSLSGIDAKGACEDGKYSYPFEEKPHERHEMATKS